MLFFKRPKRTNLYLFMHNELAQGTNNLNSINLDTTDSDLVVSKRRFHSLMGGRKLCRALLLPFRAPCSWSWWSPMAQFCRDSIPPTFHPFRGSLMPRCSPKSRDLKHSEEKEFQLPWSFVQWSWTQPRPTLTAYHLWARSVSLGPSKNDREYYFQIMQYFHSLKIKQYFEKD